MGQVHATIRIRGVDEDTLFEVLDLLGVDAKRITVETFPTREIATAQNSTPVVHKTLTPRKRSGKVRP